MNYINTSPICLFTYNRLEETKKTVASLQKNYLASKSDLFIFSDSWKLEKDKDKVLKVRNFLKTIVGFRSVKIIESPNNNGLAKSIISGVSKVLETHDYLIVLEDDLITSPNFLDFMNQALLTYKDNKKIFSISGYTMNLSSLSNVKDDYYIGVRASSWGWGTWRRSWINIDWEIKDYTDFVGDPKAKKEFSLGGSDMLGMLKSQMKGNIDSWAIRWCYNQFRRNQFTVFPTLSKIQSIGFSNEATHTKNGKRFLTDLDVGDKRKFDLPSEVAINCEHIKNFRENFSLINRLLNKINL